MLEKNELEVVLEQVFGRFGQEWEVIERPGKIEVEFETGVVEHIGDLLKKIDGRKYERVDIVSVEEKVAEEDGIEVTEDHQVLIFR